MTWWKNVASMEVRKILAYRSDFWVNFIGQVLIQLFVARALWEMIFNTRGLSEIRGYTLELMTLYYLVVTVGMRILSGESIGFVAREVYDGSFTRYLLYPVSIFQYKSVTYLTYSFFYSLQLIIIYVFFRFFISGSPFLIWDLVHLMIGVALFLVASIVYGMISMLIELISLWADNIWSLAVMLRFVVSFFGGGFIPLAFLPSWGQSLLAWTPFPYLISLPSRTVLGLSTSTEVSSGLLVLFIWVFLLSFIINWVWKKGQTRYSGVGI